MIITHNGMLKLMSRETEGLLYKYDNVVHSVLTL